MLAALIENEQIVENRDTQSLAYILQSPHLFFPTGYKVLQSQGAGFVQCARVTHNGKDKLVYDISRYKTLESLLPGLNSDSFSKLAANLFDILIEVKNNGFMRCENITVTPDKIFIDCNNYTVYLIYLPIDVETTPDSYGAFEMGLMTTLIDLVKNYPNLTDSVSANLFLKMADTTYTLESIRSALTDLGGRHVDSGTSGKAASGQELVNSEVEAKDNDPVIPKVAGQCPDQALAGNRARRKSLLTGIFSKSNGRQQFPAKSSFQPEIEGGATEILDNIFSPSLVLCGVRTPEKVELVVSKPEFIIGKKSDVDGVVSFNSAISRMHCKILCIESRHFIVDLASTNGTFLNETRLPANKQFPLKQGDKIRLANSNFIIKSIQ